jgi:hypothetical protein
LTMTYILIAVLAVLLLRELFIRMLSGPRR